MNYSTLLDFKIVISRGRSFNLINLLIYLYVWNISFDIKLSNSVLFVICYFDIGLFNLSILYIASLRCTAQSILFFRLHWLKFKKKSIYFNSILQSHFCWTNSQCGKKILCTCNTKKLSSHNKCFVSKD